MSGGSTSGGDVKFACPACGKRYSWKPEIAGRKAKCKCGAVMDVPEHAPALQATRPPPPPPPLVPAQESEEDLYDIREEEGACPSCRRDMPPGAVVCVNCGFNRKTGQRLSTTAGRPATAPTARAATRPAPRPAEAVPDDETPAPRRPTLSAYPVKKKLSDEPYQTPFNDNWKGYVAIVFGLGIIALGLYWMGNFDESWFERRSSSGFRRGRGYVGLLRLLYEMVGKWGIIIITELIGLAVGFWGWGVVTGKIDPNSGDD